MPRAENSGPLPYFYEILPRVELTNRLPFLFDSSFRTPIGSYRYLRARLTRPQVVVSVHSERSRSFFEYGEDDD